MTPLEERPRYRPGGVSWARLPLLAAGMLGTALVIGWLLHFGFLHGFYLIMVMPIVAAVALGGVGYALVGVSHCRNRWLAAGIGLTAGLVAYLSYYQFCFADSMPPGLKWRVDLLPQYIELRVRTDVSVDVGASPQQHNQTPFVPLNLFAFLFEMALMATFAAVMPANRAGRAYCRELGQWMRQKLAVLPANSGAELRQALDTGRLEQFVNSLRIGGMTPHGCRLILEYADGGSSVLDHPVYATLYDIPARPSRFRTQDRLLRQVALEPDEVLALRRFYPELARLLPGVQVEFRQRPPADLLARDRPPTDVAQIWPVPEPYRQRVRGPGYKFWVNLLDATPAAYFFGGAAAAGVGVWQITKGELALGGGLIALGLPALVWGAYSGVLCPFVYANRAIERWLRREVGQRPDPLVDARDPDAMYVSLIPRESFAEIRCTFSSDLMLLKFDAGRRQLLMEGDTDRYRIPAGAVARCEALGFNAPIDPSTQLWVVRLVVHLEEGMRELLLSVNPRRWVPMSNARRQSVAEEMCRRIGAFIG